MIIMMVTVIITLSQNDDGGSDHGGDSGVHDDGDTGRNDDGIPLQEYRSPVQLANPIVMCTYW